METMDDGELLREYATAGSETAFAALVQRHIHLVYSSALRQVRNAQMAEDFSSAFFCVICGQIIPVDHWEYVATSFVAML
jgi:hypothetical protein